MFCLVLCSLGKDNNSAIYIRFTNTAVECIVSNFSLSLMFKNTRQQGHSVSWKTLFSSLFLQFTCTESISSLPGTGVFRIQPQGHYSENQCY